MFHRMEKSKAPQPNNPAPTQDQQQVRFNEINQYQRPASEQDSAHAKIPAAAPPVMAPPVHQSQPVSQPQPQPAISQTQKEPQAMTNVNPNTTTEDYAAPRSLDASAASMQRPGQTAPAARPGAPYPGFQASVFPAAGARKDQPGAVQAAPAEQSRLTISRGITISGEIEACDYLVVEGTVEASLKGARVLDVAEGGTFYGTVEIEEAAIAGRFEGDITVNGRLTIRSTGMITGSISYKELEVESGAVIDGKLTPVGAQTEGRRQQNSAKAKKEVRKDSGNGEGELFSTKAAAE